MERQHERFMKIVGLLGAVVLTSPFALGQSQGSINFGGEWGTLSYDYTVSSGSCGSTGQWTEWTYSSLVYSVPSGPNFQLNGGGVYYSSSGSQGCPPSGPQPASITYGSVNNGFLITWVPGPSGTGSATLQLYGNLLPKYMLLSLMYAPPGHSSNFTYQTTSTLGTSTNITSSFTSGAQSSLTVSVGASVPCGGSSSGGNNSSGGGKPQPVCANGSSGSTQGSGFTQEQDSSNSVAVSQKTGFTLAISGPQSNDCEPQYDGLTVAQADALGLDHNYDQFIVWLNPAVNVGGAPGGALYWTGYQSNSEDEPNENYVLLNVNWLEDQNFLSDGANSAPQYCWEYVPGVITELGRGWDTSLPTTESGISESDLSTILKVEPYVNDPHASTTQIDTTRYTNMGLPDFLYETNQNYENLSECYTTSFSQMLGYKDTYSETMGSSFSFSVLGGVISASLSNTSTMTTVSGSSNTRSQEVGECVNFTLVGPIVGSGYSGPSNFQLYQDNIYGTLMLNPVN